MFKEEEIKEFLVKYGKRWLFPDFTNKLTWLVAGTGCAILVTPVALEQLVYNWLVKTINLNAGVPITLSELDSGTSDYWFGFGLIFFALAHNIANKYFIYKSNLNDTLVKDRLIEVDRDLFNRFLEVFHPSSRSVLFLRDVDLGGTYHDNETKELEAFSNTWDTTDCEFHDQELEAIRKELLSKARKFLWNLACNSYAIGSSSRYRCVPDAYVGDFNYPPEVDKVLKELNEEATELYKTHSKLIRTARKNLLC